MFFSSYGGRILPLLVLAMVSIGFGRAVQAQSSIAPGELAALPPEVRQYFYERPVKKRALVIGIAKYAMLSPIPSAPFDAQSFGGKLERLGFVVDYAIDANELRSAALWNKIRSFQNSLEPGTLALFYFSGHGFQYGGLNFLAPSDMPRPLKPSELTLLTVPVDNVITRLREQRAGLSILILDACRANEATIQEPDGVEKSSGLSGLALQKATPPADCGVGNTIRWDRRWLQ